MKTTFATFALIVLSTLFNPVAAQQPERVAFSAAASANDNFQLHVGSPFAANLNGATGSLQVAGEYGDNTIAESALLSNDFAAPSSMGVAVYPNPTQDVLMVTFEEKAFPQLNARLFDLQGQVVGTRILKNGRGEVDMLPLAPGTYVLELRNAEGERVSFKIIKTK